MPGRPCGTPFQRELSCAQSSWVLQVGDNGDKGVKFEGFRDEMPITPSAQNTWQKVRRLSQDAFHISPQARERGLRSQRSARRTVAQLKDRNNRGQLLEPQSDRARSAQRCPRCSCLLAPAELCLIARSRHPPSLDLSTKNGATHHRQWHTALRPGRGSGRRAAARCQGRWRGRAGRLPRCHCAPGSGGSMAATPSQAPMTERYGKK